MAVRGVRPQCQKTDRPGHDRRYAIDASKIEIELGWKADENFETGIVKTVKWYIKKYEKELVRQ